MTIIIHPIKKGLSKFLPLLTPIIIIGKTNIGFYIHLKYQFTHKFQKNKVIL